jgi:hypothetical protein
LDGGWGEREHGAIDQDVRNGERERKRQYILLIPYGADVRDIREYMHRTGVQVGSCGDKEQ